eukprot:IDg10481t1
MEKLKDVTDADIPLFLSLDVLDEEVLPEKILFTSAEMIRVQKNFYNF